MINTIAIGADHRGFLYKEFIRTHYENIFDYGAFSQERSDYPVFAKLVILKVLSGDVDGGILLCGSGVGMAIAANRFPGIYAAVAWNKEVACSARQDDWCNVLVIPADFITPDLVLEIIEGWRTATPKEGRYLKRIQMIDQIGE